MDKTAQVEALIDRAAETANANDALKFTQAAANAANAMCAVKAALNYERANGIA